MPNLDELQIQINGEAQSANKAIDSLITKLSTLSRSLGSLDSNGTSIANFASGVQKLSSAMNALSGIKTTDFNRLSNNLTKISNLNTNNLGGLATNIASISKAFSGLNGLSSGAAEVGTLASAIKNLGTANVSKAISNLPQISTALKSLMSDLANVPSVSQNLITITNSLSRFMTSVSSLGSANISINSVATTSSKLKSASSYWDIFSSAAKSAASSIGNAAKNIVLKISGLSSASSGLSGFGSLLSQFVGGLSLSRLGSWANEAIELGSSIIEVENVVDKAFGSMSQKAYDFASTSTEAYGISELKAKEYSGTLMSMMTSSGIAQDAATEMSLKLTALAGDLASFYNTTTDVAYQKLQSGIVGMVEPLRQFGISVTQANLQQYALTQGITTSVSAMTEAQKVMLRYAYILDQTSTIQGDFADTSASWANQTRILKLQIDSIAASIGQGLIAAILPVVRGLNLLMAKIQQAANYFAKFMKYLTGTELSGSTGQLQDTTSTISTSSSSAASSLGDIASAADEAASSVSDTSSNLSNTASGISDISNSLANVSDSVSDASSSVADSTKNASSNVKDLSSNLGSTSSSSKKASSSVSDVTESVEDLEETLDILSFDEINKLSDVAEAASKTPSSNGGSSTPDTSTPSSGNTGGSSTPSTTPSSGKTPSSGSSTTPSSGKTPSSGSSTTPSSSSSPLVDDTVYDTSAPDMGVLDVEEVADTFYSRLADALRNQRWEEAGKIIADGINKGLQAIYDFINWDNVGSTISTVCEGIVGVANSIVENLDWDLLGRTIGAGFNTVVNTANLLIGDNGFNFENLGNKLSVGLRGAIDEINWTNFGELIGNRIMIGWRVLEGFVDGMDEKIRGLNGWQEAGIAFGEAMNGIFNRVDFNTMGHVIAHGLNGIMDFVNEAITTWSFSDSVASFVSGLNQLFDEVRWDDLGATLSSLFIEALKGFDTAIEDFDWQGLGASIRDFILGIKWGEVLLECVDVIASAIGGIFSLAWGLVFGDDDTEYTEIVEKFSDYAEGLSEEIANVAKDAEKQYKSVESIVDDFLELNEKLKKDGELSILDATKFEEYKNILLDYAPEMVNQIDEITGAYMGTREELEKLIETQKQAALAEGYKSIMEEAAKNWAQAKIELSKIFDSIVEELSNNDLVEQAFQSSRNFDGEGFRYTREQLSAELDSLLELMKEGKLDTDNLTESQQMLWFSMEEGTAELKNLQKDWANQSDALDKCSAELDNATAAYDECVSSMDSVSSTASDAASNFTQVYNAAKSVAEGTRDSAQEAAAYIGDLSSLSESEKQALYDYATGMSEKSSEVSAALEKLSSKDRKTIEGYASQYSNVSKLVEKYGNSIKSLPSSKEVKLKTTTDNLYSSLNGLKLDIDLKAKALDTKEVDGKATVKATAAVTKATSGVSSLSLSNVSAGISQVTNDSMLKVSNVAAGVSNTIDEIPEGSKVLSNYIARFDSKQDNIQDKVINDATAVLSNKIDMISDKSLNNYTVTLSNKIDGIADKNFNGYNATLTTKTDAIADKNFNGYNATLTTKTDAIGDRNFNGYNATMTSKTDSIGDRNFWNWNAIMTNKTDSIGDRNFWNWNAIMTSKTDSVGDRSFYGMTAFISQTIKQGNPILYGVVASISSVIGAIGSLFGRAEGGVLTNAGWKPIQMYAGGGTPNQGQLFVANEAGPELVGSLGGHTAVMNNDQIVASVASGVEGAVYRAMAAVLPKMAQSNVNVSLQGDAAGLFKVVKSENNRLVRATGAAQLLV